MVKQAGQERLDFESLIGELSAQLEVWAGAALRNPGLACHGHVVTWLQQELAARAAHT